MRQTIVRLLCCTALLPAAASCESQGSTLTSIGIVVDGRIDNSEIWFELARIDQRFVLDTAKVPDAEAFFEVLQDSADTGRSVIVAFDPGSGYFDAGAAIPRYVVRSIEYDGKTIQGMKGARRMHRAVAATEAALAHGVALYMGNRYDQAVPELDRALSDERLRPPLKALAFKTRGYALSENIWATRMDLTEDDDRRLIRALGDFRAWATIEPDSMDAQSSIASTLRDLGAYDEALGIFRENQRRWPEQGIRGATRVGATYRILGDYEKALAVLDDLVTREGPQEGMMFHYHRGWTLNLLGRYEEAIGAFTEGLNTQPDYSYAFVRRACSYAMLGRLEEALADHRRADAEHEIVWRDSPPTPATLHDRRWSEGVAAALEAAIASGSKDPLPAPCEGAWHYGETKRDRSRLLPPATPAAHEAKG